MTSQAFNSEAFIKQARTSLDEARAFDSIDENAYTRDMRLQESIAYSLLVIAQNIVQQTNNQALTTSGSSH